MKYCTNHIPMAQFIDIALVNALSIRQGIYFLLELLDRRIQGTNLISKLLECGNIGNSFFLETCTKCLQHVPFNITFSERENKISQHAN